MITYNFFRYLYQHIKCSKILRKVYKEENLIQNLSSLFSSEFRVDWFGRLYTVLNPNINKNDYDGTTQIFEYNENGLDNTVYVERWVMEKLNIASQFIKNNDLFDILTYNIKKLDDYDNFLFVMQPITFDDCKTWTKRFVWLMLAILVIGVTLLMVF